MCRFFLYNKISFKQKKAKYDIYARFLNFILSDIPHYGHYFKVEFNLQTELII